MAALASGAVARGLTYLVDDEMITLGSGLGQRSWALEAEPPTAEVDWRALHDVPTAVVTGSNGKTTTVRLIAAMLEADGKRTGHSCTDGVFVAGEAVAAGDYSGPMGARTVLRDRRVEAAVLETARGGILRRGFALQRAHCAVVTNVSADHFGEYGIDNLEALADVKLATARLIGTEGLLVVNADDEMLGRRAPKLGKRLAWFSRYDFNPILRLHRMGGGPTCAARDGRLILCCDGAEHDLGAIAAMPLTVGGSATYNVANVAAATLAGYGLGIPAATMAKVLASFGARPEDNRGRLEHYALGGVRIVVDYAHNPEGLRGLLDVARALSPKGRLALLLGQAGNRVTDDIVRLADVAARYAPHLVVLKDIQGYQRGRADGEVASIMRATLLSRGIAGQAIVTELDEVEATRRILEWATPGDLLVLPVHALGARAEVLALIERLRLAQWSAGTPLPQA
jgi:UDP-N-acetylmuramyl tripeptide synthase